MVFTHEKKNDASNKNREQCFFTCEKNDIQSEASEVCEFSAKIPAIYRHLQLRRQFNEKSFFQRVFLIKKVKNILEIWVE